MNNLIAEQFSELAKGVLSDEDIEHMMPFFENLSKRINQENFQFTELQKQAIRSKDFWNSKKNNIILGSTSAGKTLIAELNMAYQIYCKEKNVLYLVPLKVLTTEKQENFVNDFYGKDVYMSSSDYQENDHDLVGGRYDIGILVYEKFFAMLAENNDSFLNHCSLVVVDELHMLSAQERGPKLEFSIEKIRFNKKKPAAILGLTTSECDETRIYEWLGKDKTEVISSPNRPITIEERFIYCDNTMDHPMIRCFISREEQQSPEFEIDHRYSDHDLPFFQLCQVLKNHPDDHIIIFCKSKRASTKIVQDLCNSGVLDKNYVKYDMFPDIVDTDMEDTVYDVFKNHMEQYSIAYHNSSLTLGMRDFVETQFREGNLRIVVATETLTMGVNMPTDVMILYDYNVYRGDEIPVKMNYQEYKNAIGRAGRLGISKDNKGISYLLVGKEQGQMDKLINRYVIQCRKEVIGTGIQEPEDKDTSLSMVLAPLYLNLLNNESFKDEDICELLENGLGRFDEEPAELAEEIIEVLKGNNPVRPKVSLPKLANTAIGFDEMEEEGVTQYDISSFGKMVSPFALSLRTYKRISLLFVEPLDEITDENARKHHLPVYNEKEPFYLDPEKALEGKPMYFIDVIYEICGMYEINENKSYLNVPKYNSANSQDQDKRDNIQKAVLSFFKNKVKPNMLWEGSQLKEFLDPAANEIPGENTLTHLYRTIVLYYWVQGYDVRNIRKVLNLPDRDEYYIYTSELESLGELCAYQLEAISKGLKSRTENSELCDMFYALSIRIKYGMSNDLSRVANKHIRGLNRARLLKVEKAARENHPRYVSVTEFIMKNDDAMYELGIKGKQLNNLRNVLQSVLKYQLDRLEDQVRRTSLVKPPFWQHYKTLETLNSSSLDSLCYLFNNFFDQPIKIVCDTESYIGQIRSSKLNICLCVLHKNFMSSQEIISECNVDVEQNEKILYLYKNGDLEDREQAKNCMNINDFCTLLLKCIVYSNTDNLSASGEHFVKLLSEQVDGEDMIHDELAVQTALEKMGAKMVDDRELQDALKKIGSKMNDDSATHGNLKAETINISINHMSVTNAENVTNNNLEITNNINAGTLNLWNNSLTELQNKYRDSFVDADAELLDEIENKFFAEAEKVIKLPGNVTQDSLEKICQSLMSDSVDPDYDRFIECMSDNDKLRTLIMQAIYAENSISSLDQLEDYSPAAVLYGKSMEHCLRSRLKPVFMRKTPKAKLSKKTNISNCPDDKFTLGAFSTILHKEFCDDADLKSDSTAGLYKKMTSEQRENWNNLYLLVDEIRDIRNHASHCGVNISTSEIRKLRMSSIKTIELTSNLPEWEALLPDSE